MFTLLTVCQIYQLPEAITLGQSVRQFHPDATIVIGLADDPTYLVDKDTIPFPVITVTDLLADNEVARLSDRYTPTEFVAAVKPAFFQAVYNQYTANDHIIYADPTVRFYQPVTSILTRFKGANILLVPYLTTPPNDSRYPDEKHFQNIGLYSSGFLAINRSDESSRFLTWWDSRVQERAYINFCEGLCTDQIWLMHVPAFFEGVQIIHDQTWHVGLWNLHERLLTQQPDGWHVSGFGPLLFANFKGLTNPDEGYFPYQNRLQRNKRPDVTQLLTAYNQLVQQNRKSTVVQKPGFGQQPEPLVLRGWRKASVDSLRKLSAFIDTMPLPVIR